MSKQDFAFGCMSPVSSPCTSICDTVWVCAGGHECEPMSCGEALDGGFTNVFGSAAACTEIVCCGFPGGGGSRDVKWDYATRCECTLANGFIDELWDHCPPIRESSHTQDSDPTHSP